MAWRRLAAGEEHRGSWAQPPGHSGPVPGQKWVGRCLMGGPHSSPAPTPHPRLPSNRPCPVDVHPQAQPALLQPCAPSALGTPRPPTRQGEHGHPQQGAARGTWQAGAFVGGVPRGAAGAPVLAGGGAAGHIGQLAVGAGMGGAAGAAVGADLIVAGATVVAEPGVLAALVDVLPAGGAVEAGWAAADVRGLEGQALAPVGTGVGGAGVRLLACLPWRGRGEGGQPASLLPAPGRPKSRGRPPGTTEVPAGDGPHGVGS